MASSNPVSGNNTTATTTVVTETSELGNEETLRLKLKKGEAAEKKKIQWTEDTVDNEGLGKKKSKVCCQYKKPRAHLDESSEDESDDDDCGDCPGH